MHAERRHRANGPLIDYPDRIVDHALARERAPAAFAAALSRPVVERGQPTETAGPWADRVR
jgi:hypothetical protein